MAQLQLNNGSFIPTIGLGTYKSQSNEVKEAVEYAIDIGYRHIDTAWYYKNESEIGEAIHEKISEGVVKREDLFIVTKLWNNFHERKNVVPKLRESLELLQLDYIDLFLIHWPFAFKRVIRVMAQLQLNNGSFIPTIGLGTYKSQSNEVKEAVEYAIDIGYRHIDTAWYYKNESEIGEAIHEKISEGVVKREDLFIVTKLWNNFHERKNVVPKLRESLELLQLDYIDLFLIHWPFAFKEDADTLPVAGPAVFSDVDYLETWEGMEECVSLGLAKSIGVSNFNESQIARLLQSCKVKPVVNQVEVNPNMNQKSLIQFCKEKDIVVTGFCPLGRSTQSVNTAGCPLSTILDPNVKKIAGKYGKTSAQVVLRYLVSLGICVIPKSVTKSRIFENFHIFDFKLSPEDISYLDSCNKNQRVSAMTAFKDHKYYPF